jgi:hypothetical protein
MEAFDWPQILPALQNLAPMAVNFLLHNIYSVHVTRTRRNGLILLEEFGLTLRTDDNEC